jgi:hypothetical protein
MVYREEVAKQLHLVRGKNLLLNNSKHCLILMTDALCQELDQERKARLTAQHKLKGKTYYS